MKWLMLSITLVALIAYDTAWAGETGESEGSQAQEPVTSNRMKDPRASAMAIGVETSQGTVQLSGAADSAEEKMNARDNWFHVS